MIRRFFLSIVILIMLIFYSGCVDKKESNPLEGEIIALEFSHLINKRNGCRKTNLLLSISLKNNGLKPIFIEGLPKYDPCSSELKRSSFQVINYDDSLIFNNVPLTIEDTLNLTKIEFREEIIIEPNEEINLKTRIDISAGYGSLEILDTIFNEFYTSDFQVYYKNENLILGKSEDFEVIFFLDDIKIDRSNEKFDFQIEPKMQLPIGSGLNDQ